MDCARPARRMRRLRAQAGRTTAGLTPCMASRPFSPEQNAGQAAGQPPLPQFDVHLTPPDVTAWTEGNIGIPGFTTRDSPRPGPHLALIAVTHGNEIAGAIALDRLLRGSLRPSRGRLTFGFVNL